jgi:NAD(P)-dependent dehydrogenase (short-subunit alcohol dehydrogenase family)
LLKESGWNVFGTTADPDATKRGFYYWNALYGSETEKMIFDLERKTALAEGEDRFFPLQLLVNNAGINGITPFEDLQQKFLQCIMQVNFIAPVMLTQRLLPHFCGGAVICNVVSDASYKPMRHSLAYNCSKAAFAMATKQLARELTKPKNLTIFSVNPGKMADTEMSHYIDRQVEHLRGWTPSEAQKYFENASVSGLESDPRHVAELIVGLCVDPVRARMLSGACIDLVG